MKYGRFVILFVIIVFILTVMFMTINKIQKKELNDKYDFIVNNFIYYSKKCVKEEKCTDNIVTLKELYDNGFITKQINPKTNKEFNEKSYIKLLNYEFILID